MRKETGEYLVRLARFVIASELGVALPAPKKPDDPELSQKMGAFVTLHSHKPRELRGCIGYIEARAALEKAVRECALHSAFGDSRFPPLKREELASVVVEVSVLTPPQKIIVKKPAEYLKAVEIGKDGLTLEYSYYRGVFLPQVPIEQGWEAQEYLSELCGKAGAEADCWLKPGARICKFQTHIFSEIEPSGKIKRES